MAWDAAVDAKTASIAAEIARRVQLDDPVRGRWTVPQTAKGTLWCDASSLAIGVCLDIDGTTVEDASWLRKVDDAAHINLAELEAVVKGLNLAVLWAIKEVDIRTDSATVFGWLRSLLEKDRPVKVHGLGEALTRRRLAIIADTITECGLAASVSLAR